MRWGTRGDNQVNRRQQRIPRVDRGPTHKVSTLGVPPGVPEVVTKASGKIFLMGLGTGCVFFFFLITKAIQLIFLFKN